MKNYILSLGIFLPFLSFGQIEFHLTSDPGAIYNGDTVTVVSNESLVHEDFQVINASGVSQGYKWRRKIISVTSLSYSDQLCDDQICFSCIGDPWTRPDFYTIAAGDSSLFQPKLNSAGLTGTAHYRYYVLNSSMILLDSLDVIFTTSVGVEETKQLEFKAYPNPASDVLNLVLTKTTGENVHVVLYNLLGSEVLRKSLSNGTNIIPLEMFDNGIYFYSIIVNNEIVETKKLIIRH